MNLWLHVHVLLAGVLLCSASAPTQEECNQLLTPMSLTDHSVFEGRWNILGVYADGFFNDVLKTMDHSWANITSEGDHMNMFEENKMNGKCFSATNKMTFDGDTVKAIFGNMTSRYYIVKSPEDHMIFIANTTITGTIDPLMDFLNFSRTLAPAVDTVLKATYLMGRGTNASDPAMELFKNLSICRGFSGEFTFQYDEKKGFCAPDEVVKMSFDSV